jgi:hypothetical protein
MNLQAGLLEDDGCDVVDWWEDRESRPMLRLMAQLRREVEQATLKRKETRPQETPEVLRRGDRCEFGTCWRTVRWPVRPLRPSIFIDRARRAAPSCSCVLACYQSAEGGGTTCAAPCHFFNAESTLSEASTTDQRHAAFTFYPDNATRTHPCRSEHHITAHRPL